MRNERVEVIRGPLKIFASHFTLLAFVLAGGLLACGKSSPGSPGAPGSPGSPGSPTTLQSIALSPSAVTIPTGMQQQFTVIGSYSDGTTAKIADGITWSSSSPIVARMSGPGSCLSTSDSTALGDRDNRYPSIYFGTTTITASVGGLSAQATVRVNAATLQSITIDPPTATIPKPAPGNAPVIQSFSVIGHFSDNTTAPLIGAYTCAPPPAPPCVDWSTSDLNVTVDPSGFAQAAPATTPGPVTITATYGAFSSTAILEVTAPVLVSIAVSPSVASIPVGFNRQFTAIGQYSDGANTPVSASWSASSAAATVGADGLAQGVTAGAQPVIITATFGGFSSTASLTVTTPVPATHVAASSTGTLNANVLSNYQVDGLTPDTEYLVNITTPDPIRTANNPAGLDPTTLQVEVDVDASFTARVCSSWAGGPPCRAGAAGANGLFVMVTGPAGTNFTLDVSPLPDLSAGDLVAGTNTETYFKITGVAATTFGATLGGLSDVFADLFVYNFAQGPGDVGASGLLCSTLPPATFPIATLADLEAWGARATVVPRNCVDQVTGLPATVPVGGVVYGTVEGWLTTAGADFTATSP